MHPVRPETKLVAAAKNAWKKEKLILVLQSQSEAEILPM